MTRLSFSVKHIVALQEHCCCRHVRAAHEELHTSKQTSDKQLQNQEKTVEVWKRGRKGRQRVWSCTDHSFTRWSVLFHRHDTDTLLCLSCCSLISPEVDALTCDGKCIMCRRKGQGFSRKDVMQRLDRERQNLINSSFEKTTHQTPFCTFSISTLYTDLTSKPDFKPANCLTQHQGEKLNNSPETQ